MRKILKDKIPEFKDLLHFTEWYINTGMPSHIPPNHEVFLSDDATATCLFRHGQYQFEMYFIHPNPLIPMHEHPGVENIELTETEWDNLTPAFLDARTQKVGQMHGKGIRERATSKGFALFSAQRWDEGIEVSTIGARWKGHTAGPKHEELIRRFNPDCLITPTTATNPGYADVTVKSSTI
jgi:hypothetical protein